MTTFPITQTPEPASRASGHLLSVRDLSVAFRDRSGTATAAAHLSFDLPDGGSLALVGESGSGKTVGTRALLQLLPENAIVSGEAHFEGRDLLAFSDDELRKVRGRKIGMVFQNAMEALNPTRTLKAQLTEHLRWHGVCGRSEALDRAITTLDRVGIPEPDRRIRMYPFQLSGGMRQRAMIAMALVAEPRLLIADEPTTAVDVTIQRQILDLLKTLRAEGLSIIMITHDLGVARYLCDDAIVMKDGEMVEHLAMSRFVSAARHPYSQKLVGAALDLDLDPAHDGQSTTPGQGVCELAATRSVTKIFRGHGGEVRAVDRVDLTISDGESVAVVGESGSGKSTLARLLVRLIDPTHGSVIFDGHDLAITKRQDLLKLRRRVQMVFQNPYGSLLPHATVANNVMEPLKVHKIGTPEQRNRRAQELLELVGIPADRADQYPRQFSGGQQQRVAIARALALDPDLLVCDEPTSALDVSIQAQILDLLDDLKQRLGLSMLFITHNLAVAQRLCDRIVVMATGHVVESGPTHAIFTDPRHPYTRTLLAAVLPVRTEPVSSSQPVERLDTESGNLVEVSPEHWVRISTNQATTNRSEGVR